MGYQVRPQPPAEAAARHLRIRWLPTQQDPLRQQFQKPAVQHMASPKSDAPCWKRPKHSHNRAPGRDIKQDQHQEHHREKACFTLKMMVTMRGAKDMTAVKSSTLRQMVRSSALSMTLQIASCGVVAHTLSWRITLGEQSAVQHHDCQAQ